MSNQEAVEMLLHAHYYLMDNPRFWYDKGLMEASKLMCVRASDLRHEGSIRSSTG